MSIAYLPVFLAMATFAFLMGGKLVLFRGHGRRAKGMRTPDFLERPSKPPPPPPEKPLWVRTLVTIIVLGLSVYCIASSAVPDGDKKWAYGTVGAIVGYWLK